MGRGTRPSEGHEAAPPTGFPEAFTNSFRAMLLGGLLGDIRNPGAEVLHSGPVSHHTCWTLDALIRHRLAVRRRHRTASEDFGPWPSPIPHVRRGLLRWGALARQWPTSHPPDGWLSGVPVLTMDRGDTPAEDEAHHDLVAQRPLSAHDSRSSSALFRVLPLAASSVTTRPDVVASWCSGTTAMTHGHPESWTATALLGVLVGSHLAGIFRHGPWLSLDAATSLHWFFDHYPDPTLFDYLRQLLIRPDWSPAALQALAPDDTTLSVLAGALYLFQHARNEPLAGVRHLAATAGSPHAVASLTCALLGLERGPGGLDTGELSRHELTWVIDALARDYCVTLWSPPSPEGEMDVLDEMTLRYPEDP